MHYGREWVRLEAADENSTSRTFMEMGVGAVMDASEELRRARPDKVAAYRR